MLLADAAINSNTQITRNVAIDLNGKTVTVTTVGTQNAFEVQNGATFTIKDSGTGGKLDLGKFGIMLMNSKLKIEGGEIKVSPDSPGAGIVVAAVGNSDVTMTGGCDEHGLLQCRLFWYADLQYFWRYAGEQGRFYRIDGY